MRGTCDHCLTPHVRLIDHTRPGDVGQYRVCAVCASKLPPPVKQELSTKH